MSTKSSSTQRPSRSPSRRTGLTPCSRSRSSIASTIDSTWRSLGAEAITKTSVMASWSLTSMSDDVGGELVRGGLSGEQRELARSVGGGHRGTSSDGVGGGSVASGRPSCGSGARGRGACLAMYWTTPSGTRYQTGSPAATRSRQSVEQIASAGTSTRLTASAGQVRRRRARSPGRVTPTKWASSNSSSASCQDRIWASASAPVMKNSSASGRCAAQVAQRVDRVRRAAAVDVDPADREPRVGRGGDDRHQVAVLGRADLAVGLLPRLAGGHEDDLVEPEQACDLAGGDEVAVVDRVERAAHDPDSSACHRTSLSGPTGAGPGGPAPADGSAGADPEAGARRTAATGSPVQPVAVQHRAVAADGAGPRTTSTPRCSTADGRVRLRPDPGTRCVHGHAAVDKSPDRQADASTTAGAGAAFRGW